MALIQGFHTCVAHFGGPHWLMNDDDARQYATAVNNALRHFDVAVAQKSIDIANAVGLACFFEGTRLLYSRMPPERRQPRPAAQVVPIFEFAPPNPPVPASSASPAGESYGPPNPQAPEGQVH